MNTPAIAQENEAEEAMKMSKSLEIHEIRKALQTFKMTHRLLELGYRFDDSKAVKMLTQLRKSVEIVEDRVTYLLFR